MSISEALARRSQLFVPANRPKFVSSASRQDTGGIIVDLEDSVPRSELPAARRELGGAVASLTQTHSVSVRVNKAFEVVIEDLDAAVIAGVSALVLPKVDTELDIKILDALVMEREIRRGLEPGLIEFQVLIETSTGLANATKIATASSRIVAMTLGVEDLATELEISPGTPGFDVSWAHSQVLLAARGAGIAPYGLLSSLSNFSDIDVLAEDVRRSRAFGFVGAFCVHPSQIPVLNAGFAPTKEEVTHAREIVAAFEEAGSRGHASVSLGGRMIDAPVAERARRVLRHQVT